MEDLNQCDGCKQGLPVVDGIHDTKEGKPFIGCTKDRYLPAKEQALTDEVKHLKESIEVIGFMLADEKAEVARLRDTEKDKARLDWMIFNSAAMYHSRDGDVCFIRWPDDEDGYWQTKPHGNNREAIDAAISGEKFHTERQLLNSKEPTDSEIPEA